MNSKFILVIKKQKKKEKDECEWSYKRKLR